MLKARRWFAQGFQPLIPNAVHPIRVSPIYPGYSIARRKSPVGARQTLQEIQYPKPQNTPWSGEFGRGPGMANWLVLSGLDPGWPWNSRRCLDLPLLAKREIRKEMFPSHTTHRRLTRTRQNCRSTSALSGIAALSIVAVVTPCAFVVTVVPSNSPDHSSRVLDASIR